MKFSVATITALLLADPAMAFAPVPLSRTTNSNSARFMAMDMPPAATDTTAAAVVQTSSDLPVVQQSAMGQPSAVRYSDFLKLVSGDKIEKVTFSADGGQLLGVDVDGSRLRIDSLPNDPDLLNQLTTHKVDVTVLPAQEASGLGDLAQSLVFPAILFAGLFFLSRGGAGGQGGGGGMAGMGGPGGMGGFGKSKAEVQMVPDTGVTFDDVAGCDGAKLELSEVVDFLKQPEAYTANGCQIPRGVILDGPPGTGKTLLAKAVAGEAGVPFIAISGSEFVEMFVGVGASRVRDIFGQAKKNAPCIIFIDEIDAVGGTRKLKDQSALKMTLNELLVQLDGFDENNGIIVIGATNFMESLDTALLRPGRFDKHVSVPLPDVGGRKEILELYAQKTKLSKDVDLNVLARGTTGLSGADLYNLMNQAALKASVDGLNSITMTVLEYAKDKILMGAERKTAVITAETARCTAYHEAGHAIVAILTDGAMPVHKATIMPRGASLGMVSMLPDGDQTSKSYKEMVAYMDICMGGRVAEELIFGQENVTSGAASDIQQATNVARAMVTKYGFSSQVGIVFHDGNVGEASASPETRARIDEEVKKMTQAAYDRAKDMLKKNHRAHHLLAQTLLEYETLTGDEVRDVVKKGKKPKRPVVNTEQGQRGDTSILANPSKKPSAGGTINGWGRKRTGQPQE
mmetsp:Transcript_6803/g.11277  ORF Transcript_6803/g.11277 Transcript_6803/m.11277 type:complete len:686 (-) Transcript_6803:136-2193(-)